MGTKQVRLDEDLYAKIADKKHPDETFSDAIERLLTDWDMAEFDMGFDEEELTAFQDAVDDIEETTAENIDETLEALGAHTDE